LDDRNAPDPLKSAGRLRAEGRHAHAALVERLEQFEERLLNAFHYFTELNKQAEIRNRLATIEYRLLQVEKRLNMPPTA
jgi:hypothetical protein